MNKEAVTFSRAPTVGYKIRRFARISSETAAFVRFLIQQKLGAALGAEDDPSQRSRKAAEYLRDQFVALGPTFIKSGQILSTRADILSPTWLEVFASLQAEVPPMPFEDGIAVIRSELGGRAQESIAWISEKPIAAASIGQVHRAGLKDGRQIVLKVQRPGIEELIRTDLSILRSIAIHCSAVPGLSGGQDLVGTIDQMATTLRQELDFTEEGKNFDVFGRVFSDPALRVVVPKVEWSLTTKHVLALEYVEGISARNLQVSPEQITAYMQILIGAFLHQYVVAGIYHADPHPGNVAFLKDGRVVFYDCGMLGRLTSSMRDTLLRIAGDAIKLDEESLLADLVAAQILPAQVIGNPSILDLIERFLETLGSRGLSGETVTLLTQQLMEQSSTARVSFPQELLLLGRSLIELEGLLAMLGAIAPGVDYRRVALPKASPLLEKILGEPVSVLERIPYDLKRTANAAQMVARKSQRAFRKLEQGQLEFPVRDRDAARATRRLALGFRSVGSAILFMTFSGLAGLAFHDHNAFLGVPMLTAGLFFMGRWLVAEQRMES